MSSVLSFSMTPKLYSTEQAAKAVGITRATLQAWIKAGKFTPPAPTLEGAVAKRLWSTSDLGRLRKMKKQIYWKGQGRPRKKK
jgi:predicted site-specific integrase-resolvase